MAEQTRQELLVLLGELNLSLEKYMVALEEIAGEEGITPPAPVPVPVPAPAPAPVPVPAPDPVTAGMASILATGGHPGLNSYSLLRVPAGSTTVIDFKINGPERDDGGYQGWTNQPWAVVSYTGTPGEYQLTLDATALTVGTHKLVLTANNDAGPVHQDVAIIVSEVVGEAAGVPGDDLVSPLSPVPAPTPAPTPVPIPAPGVAGPAPVLETFSNVRHWLVKLGESPRVVSPQLNGQHFDRWPVSAKWKGGVSGGYPNVPVGLVRNHSQELVASMAKFYQNGPDNPDFSDLRVYARAFAERGVPIFASLYGIPTWLSMFPEQRSRWPSWPGMHACPTDWNVYARLVRETLQCIKDEGAQVVALAGPNEPDMLGRDTAQESWSGGYPGFWIGNTLRNDETGKAMRMAALADMVRVLGIAGKAVFPGLMNCTPEFVWYSNQRSVYEPLYAFIAEQKCSDGSPVRPHIDAIAAHHYDWGRNILDYSDKAASVAATRDIIDPAMPVYMSEVAVFENKGAAAWTLPTARHAMLNRQRLFVTASHGFDSVLHWIWDRSDSTDPNGGVCFIGNPAKHADVEKSFSDSLDVLDRSTIWQSAVLNDNTVMLQTGAGVYVAK